MTDCICPSYIGDAADQSQGGGDQCLENVLYI